MINSIRSFTRDPFQAKALDVLALTRKYQNKAGGLLGSAKHWMPIVKDIVPQLGSMEALMDIAQGFDVDEFVRKQDSDLDKMESELNYAYKELDEIVTQQELHLDLNHAPLVYQLATAYTDFQSTSDKRKSGGGMLMKMATPMITRAATRHMKNQAIARQAATAAAAPPVSNEPPKPTVPVTGG